MNDIGYFSLLLAFMTAAYGGVTGVVGARARNPQMIASGAHGVVATFGLLTLSSIVLVYHLYTGNFQVEYVASYTSSTLPDFYRVTALWAGQKGSLLLWVWTLSLFALVVHLTNRDRNQSLIPYVHAVMMSVVLFFIALLIFVADPFELLPFVPAEGRGLNPVLQMPLMIIHPPILYQGYVGTVVPFAFAMAALMTGELGDTWIRTIRRWTLYAWFFLGFGLMLGGRWAYVELGWGGYWAWDPVENAALMPWLTITAFLHSVMIQEKKGMLKIWNFILIILTFGLVYFGTFLTRSGVVSSVHSFTTSGIGPMFMGFVVVSMVLSFGLLISRRRALKARSELDSFVSRESSFLLNNLALVGVCFAILWGTIFPVLSEAVSGEKITVSAPYFNQINVPAGHLPPLPDGSGPPLRLAQDVRAQPQAALHHTRGLLPRRGRHPVRRRRPARLRPALLQHVRLRGRGHRTGVLPRRPRAPFDERGVLARGVLPPGHGLQAPVRRLHRAYRHRAALRGVYRVRLQPGGELRGP